MDIPFLFKCDVLEAIFRNIKGIILCAYTMKINNGNFLFKLAFFILKRMNI